MDIKEFLQTASNFATTVGLGVLIYQIWVSQKQKSVEYTLGLYTSIFSNRNVTDIYYLIEYDNLTIELIQNNSDIEKGLDHLLSIFDQIGYLVRNNKISIKDTNFVHYEILVTYQNQSVINYLNFLDNWFETRNINVTKFSNFRWLGDKLQE